MDTPDMLKHLLLTAAAAILPLAPAAYAQEVETTSVAPPETGRDQVRKGESAGMPQITPMDETPGVVEVDGDERRSGEESPTPAGGTEAPGTPGLEAAWPEGEGPLTFEGSDDSMGGIFVTVDGDERRSGEESPTPAGGTEAPGTAGLEAVWPEGEGVDSTFAGTPELLGLETDDGDERRPGQQSPTPTGGTEAPDEAGLPAVGDGSEIAPPMPFDGDRSPGVRKGGNEMRGGIDAPPDSEDPSPIVGTQPAPERDVDPALFVLRDEDTTVYLFGTIHVMRRGLGWFDDAVRAAFDASSEVMLEMVPPPGMGMTSIIDRLAYNSGGPTLTRQLPAGRREEFRAAIRRTGMPASLYDRYDPWFVSITLTGPATARLGLDSGIGADVTILETARREGKQVAGFDSPEQQIGYFDNLPQPVQLRMLLQALDTLDEADAMTEATLEAWATGNLDQIVQITNDGLRAVPEVGQALLTDRNARWADWIARRMDRPGTVFVAVGAAHLAGEDSVQTMLAQRQLVAERVVY